MRRTTGPVAQKPLRQRLPGVAGLILLSCLTAAPLQAQDGMSGVSPWSTFGNPMTLSPWSTSPSTYGSPFDNQWPGQSGFTTPYHQQPYGARQTPYSGQSLTCPDAQGADSHQPDLTGSWRGSGGESVEVQRNYARIWGGDDKPCNCIFFLVGQRLIAYSPDTDVVRKYWYKSGGSNQFTLVDESGNVMTYQRTR